MAETLYIRLGSEKDDEISWLIFSSVEQEIIASGVLTNAIQLSDLTEKAEQRIVKVFVPGCDVVLKQLTLPTKSQRSMRAAVPYMLEDELAEDVDDLFFAYDDLSENEAGHNCFAALVAHSQMQSWLGWLSDANIKAKTLQVDVLAMPYSPEHWTAISFPSSQQTQVIVRQGKWQGFVVDDAAWKFATENLYCQNDDEENPSPVFKAYSELPHSEKLSLESASEELPLALLAQHCHESKFNLLQAQYKVKDKNSKTVTNWLWVAGIAVCALLLNIGYKTTLSLQMTAQQEQVEAQIIASYKKAFPEAKRVRIGTIKSQLNRKIAELGGANDNEGFLAMLSKVQPAFAKVPKLKPESLKFDGKRQELRLQAVADDYQDFEQFKNALNSAKFNVKQGAQNNQGEKITGSYSITNADNSSARSNTKERS